MKNEQIGNSEAEINKTEAVFSTNSADSMPHIRKLFYLIFILIVMLMSGLVGYAIGRYQNSTNQLPKEIMELPAEADPEENPPDEQVFCTMDAKICPDGSSVGRVPPSCEFAPCPGL